MAHDHRMNEVGEPHLNKVNRMRREMATDPRNTNDDWYNLGNVAGKNWEPEDDISRDRLGSADMDDAEDMSYRGHDPAEILYGNSTARRVRDMDQAKYMTYGTTGRGDNANSY
jgi:hypothetical protein